MDSQQVFTFGQQGLYMLLMVSAPVLLTVLAVGLVVSVFQAATQIQEQSLVFVPKVLTLLAALSVCGGWMMTRMVEFTRSLFLSLPHLIQ